MPYIVVLYHNHTDHRSDIVGNNRLQPIRERNICSWGNVISTRASELLARSVCSYLPPLAAEPDMRFGDMYSSSHLPLHCCIFFLFSYGNVSSSETASIYFKLYLSQESIIAFGVHPHASIGKRDPGNRCPS